MGDETETTVTVETTEPETVASETPEVVVVNTDAGDDGGNDLEIGVALGALTATVEALVSRVDEIDARTTVTEIVAENAVERADDAVEIAVDASMESAAVAEEVAEETAEETVEEFIEPQRDHWLWRKPINLRRARSEVDA